MATEKPAPETLLEAVTFFSDPDVALNFVANLRWPDGVTCPRCDAREVSFLKTRRLWKCKGCKKQFSAKVGTIFEDSPIPLEKWLPAMWMLVNCKNGISSYELARALGVTQKTGWFMLHRLRAATQAKSFQKMEGHVEVDETFIGGRARYMNKARLARVYGEGATKGRSGRAGKVAVMGLLERHGENGASQVRTHVVANVRRHRLQARVKMNVKMDGQSTIYSDALKSYEGLDDTYTHKVIDHAEAYAIGNVHTNGMENFWSLLKRTIKGTYVSVEPFHLFRYLDEQCFRFNQRKGTDGSRFIDALSAIFGRRLTYAALTTAPEPQRW